MNSNGYVIIDKLTYTTFGMQLLFNEYAFRLSSQWALSDQLHFLVFKRSPIGFKFYINYAFIQTNAQLNQANFNIGFNAYE